MEKKNAIQRDDGGIDIVEGKDKGGSRIVEQIALDTLVIHETTLKQIERTYWSHSELNSAQGSIHS